MIADIDTTNHGEAVVHDHYFVMKTSSEIGMTAAEKGFKKTEMDAGII
jgi:hypothetical protein